MIFRYELLWQNVENWTDPYLQIVIQAQRYVRSFLAIRQAEINLLSMQWDKLLPLWWTNRAKEKEEAHATSSTKLKETKVEKAKKLKSLASNKDKTLCTVQVKNRFIEESLMSRRKQAHTAFLEWTRRIEQQVEDHSKNAWINSVRGNSIGSALIPESVKSPAGSGNVRATSAVKPAVEADLPNGRRPRMKGKAFYIQVHSCRLGESVQTSLMEV